MNALLLLIPIALGLGILGLLAFLWSIKSGQFDDLEGAAERILYDDDLPLPIENSAHADRPNIPKAGE